jgi:hypothetical protein
MHRAKVLIDLAAVLLFVGIGRSVHADGLSIAGFASTAWPFVVGLGVGWAVCAAWRWSMTSIACGLMTSAVTVAVGMTLRVVAGQGIAFAFVLVALGFLAATMLGWRLCITVLRRWRPPQRA